MKNIIITLAILLAAIGNVLSQDIHFAQFTLTPLIINPAQAGTTTWIRAGVSYREQWRSVSVPFQTLSASFDMKVKKRWEKQSESIVSRRKTLFFQKVSETGLGWGVNLFSDKAGTSKMGTTQANFSLAYQMKTGKSTLFAAGLQAGFAQRSVRYDELKWGSQYDQAAGSYNPNLSTQEDLSNSNLAYPDFGAGIVWTYRKNERYMRGNDQKDIYLGASAFHLMEPSYSFIGTNEILYRKYIVHGHSLLGIKNTNYSLTPSFMFARQGSATEFLFGSMIRYMLKEDSRYTGYVKGAAIAVGGFYRTKDALIVTGLYEMSTYAIGISYDINVSQLKTVSTGRGGVEITLRLLNPSPFLYSTASFK